MGIKQRFLEAARHNRPLRSFVAHSGKIGFAMSIAGNFLIVANETEKQRQLAFDFMTASGALDFLSTIAMLGFDRHPFLKRVSGGLTLGAFGLLFADAAGKPKFQELLLGSLLPIVACAAMIFESNNPNSSQLTNPVQRLLYKFTKSPVFWTAILSALSKPFQGIYGQENNEKLFTIAVVLYALENLATATTDNSVKAFFGFGKKDGLEPLPEIK